MNTYLSGIILLSCLAWQAYGQVTCTSAGRVAVPTDTTCQNYVLCVLNTTSNTFVSYNYTCPTTSVFNPASALCTAPTNYVCNVTTSSVCTVEGYQVDTTSTDCTTYIQCVQINGVFTATTLTCPPNTFYNPTSTLCETNYNCTTTAAAFTCNAPGRFADTTDTTCQNYFYCVLSGTTYLQYNYTCPTTSLFNPNSALCTGTYTCTN